MKSEELTILIIAQNEEHNLKAAIESCQDLGAVLVIDGGSSDRTPAVAAEQGARVVHNPFRYSAQQYNFGLGLIETPWAFVLDADERMDAELVASIRATAPNSDVVAFEVDRLNYFCGKPIRHSGWTPDRNVRLMRVDACAYDDRPVHARVIARGATRRLDGRLHHFSYDSVTHYVTKLNRLTSREVEARGIQQKKLDARSRARAIFLKLPFKPMQRFLYMYVFRRGFMDGRAGLSLARLSGAYEVIVRAKQRFPDVNRLDRGGLG